MITDLLIALALLSTVTAVSAVGVALLMLKKLRTSVAHALNETANQQLLVTQHMSESIGQLQRQQQIQGQHLQKLAEAHLQIRQDLVTFSTRLENNERQIYGEPERRILN